MRSIDELATEICTLTGHINRSVHEGGIRIEILDDGALRLVKPDGRSVDSVAPGYTQPKGDWRQMPTGTFASKWRGEKMDMSLAVEILMQRDRKSDVPAGTSVLYKEPA